MSGKAAHLNDFPISSAQVRLELDSARKTVERLERALKLVGNAGVADAETAIELETHLGAAYAAAYRWLLETRLQASGCGIAPAR